MTRLQLPAALLAGAIAFAALGDAACGGHKAQPTPPKTSDAGLPLLIKSVALSFQSQPEGNVSHVFLAVMDETGKTLTYPIGDVPGTCTSIAADGSDLMTLECMSPSTAGGAGAVRLHAIKQQQEVVILRENIVPGAKPDPMNRDEIQRVQIPVDTKIDVAK